MTGQGRTGRLARMEKIGERAVVIGAGIGGLLAARALADAYERVMVIDRDALPPGGENRRAVPQGRHGHALLPKGLDTLEELLPGIGGEMIEDGAPTTGPLSDTRFILAGHELPRVAFGTTGIVASRPFIESHVRRRVLALANVELRERCEVRGLTATPDRRRVTGVTACGAEGGAEEDLAADMVVAAGGRSARVPGWLEGLGYERPRESVVEIDLGYSSRNYRLSPGAVADSLILISARPGKPRGMALFVQEGDRSLLTLSGYGEHKPPAEEDAFEAFLTTVAPPDVLAALREAEPLDEIVSFRTPANRRRHYERMRRFPERLLLTGDAICNFNPAYGQGMTVAALEAAALRRCLERGERRLRRRFFRAAARIVDPAWRLAVGGDLALPEVKGKRPPSVRLANAYTQRLRETAEQDAEVTTAFMRVTGMLDSPWRIMRPAIARRVLARRKPDSLLWPGRPLSSPLRRRPTRSSSCTAYRARGRTSSPCSPPRAGSDVQSPGMLPASARPTSPKLSSTAWTATPASSAVRWMSWGSSAPTSSCTTSAGPGACAGRSESQSGWSARP